MNITLVPARCPDETFPGITVWNYKNTFMPFQTEFFRPLTLKSHIFLFLQILSGLQKLYRHLRKQEILTVRFYLLPVCPAKVPVFVYFLVMQIWLQR